MPLQKGSSRGQMIALFAGAVVSGGLIVGMLIYVAPDIWASLAYRPTEAVVAEREMVYYCTFKGWKQYRLATLLSYTVDGRDYQCWTVWGGETQKRSATGKDAESVLTRVQPGDRVTCWYDPFRPSSAKVDKSQERGSWLCLIAVAWAAVMFFACVHGMAVVRRTPRLSP